MPTHWDQALASTAVMKDIDHFATGVLPIPVLLSPDDGEELCDGLSTDPNSIEGVILKWEEICNADWYSVQVAKNSSFTGPTVTTTKVLTNQHEIALEDIDPNSTYFWRIKAFASNGRQSVTSEPWQFKYHCKDAKGEPAKRKSKHPGKGLNFCQEIHFKGEIEGGKADMMCDDLQSFLAKISWKCVDEFGPLAVLKTGVWSLDGAGAGVTIVDQNKWKCRVKCDRAKKQAFWLEYTATFQLRNGVIFACKATRKILVVDCPEDKPQFPLHEANMYLWCCQDDSTTGGPTNPMDWSLIYQGHTPDTPPSYSGSTPGEIAIIGACDCTTTAAP